VREPAHDDDVEVEMLAEVADADAGGRAVEPRERGRRCFTARRSSNPLRNSSSKSSRSGDVWPARWGVHRIAVVAKPQRHGKRVIRPPRGGDITETVPSTASG
jgi:hypothetical protein